MASFYSYTRTPVGRPRPPIEGWFSDRYHLSANYIVSPCKDIILRVQALITNKQTNKQKKNTADQISKS